jgi:hypothetical protein
MIYGFDSLYFLSYLSLNNQEYVTKAQVYIQIVQVVAVSSYLPGFLGSTKMSKSANMTYIIHIPESVCHFPQLFYW